MNVLLLMSRTGGGHRAAAEALAAALRAEQADVNVEILDVIEEMSGFWHALVRLYGPMVRMAPWAWGTLFKAFDAGGATLWKAMLPLVLGSVRHKLVAFVDGRAPDVVCSTHPLINQGIDYGRRLYARERGRKVPFVIMVTDPVTVHPTWVEPAADAICVATPQARNQVLAAGAKPQQVHVTGMPVHPSFFARVSSASAARIRLGIPAAGPVLLLCGGGEGLRRMVPLAEAMLTLPLFPHVLAVAGHDVDAQRQLHVLAEQFGGRLKVFGFTDQMPTLMSAADVVVTKAGPGVLFEAMALGKPVVIVDAIPGQEAGNVELVQQHGTGLVARHGVAEARAAVARLLADPGLSQRCATAGRALVDADAALRVARLILAQGAGERGAHLRTA